MWLPAPRSDVEGMLRAAELKEGELLVDLGCGDARALIIGAKKFGARGRGVEIDPLKVWLARLLVKRAGVDDRVTIVRGDIFRSDTSDADVVYVYMSHQALDRLSPLLKNGLKEGARIASFGFMLSGYPLWKVYGPKKGFLYRSGVGEKLDSLA